MAKRLTTEQRAFVVQALARFETPMEVAGAVREEFGVEITPQSIEAYDPTKRAGERLIERWRDLFFETRRRCLESLEGIPIAHKAVRVKYLAKAADAFKARENYIAMAKMLEQVAKEMGNVYSNRREFTGRAGGPIRVEELSEAQVEAQLTRLLEQAGLSLSPAASEDQQPVH